MKIHGTTMKIISALCIAFAAAAPAFGQDSNTDKACYKRCLDVISADKIKKHHYDYEAINSDPTKTEAEKKKSHKRAVATACNSICEN